MSRCLFRKGTPGSTWGWGLRNGACPAVVRDSRYALFLYWVMNAQSSNQNERCADKWSADYSRPLVASASASRACVHGTLAECSWSLNRVNCNREVLLRDPLGPATKETKGVCLQCQWSSRISKCDLARKGH